MKLIKKLRKGFTLIELVVVIAVIAVLAAVSVVSYVAITNKAKQSSDEQAVRQMNTALKASGILGAKDITDLFNVLSEEGMDAKNYKPLAKDTYFFWDQENNEIVYAKYKDGQYVGIYPESYKDKGKGDHHWFSLSKEIKTVKVDKQTNGNYTVSNAEELYTILTEDEHAPTQITLNSDIDLMGADVTFDGITEFNGNDKTLSNLSQLENNGFDKSQAEDSNSGLFGQVGRDENSKTGVTQLTETVNISHLTIENSVIGSSNTKFCGLLVGAIRGGSTVNVSDVTIKNCTIYALQKGGSLVGYMPNGVLNLASSVKVTGCKVATLLGEGGKLVGAAHGGAQINNEMDMSKFDVSLESIKQDNQVVVDIKSARPEAIKVGSADAVGISAGQLIYNKSDAKNYEPITVNGEKTYNFDNQIKYCFRFFNKNALVTLASSSAKADSKFSYNGVEYVNPKTLGSGKEVSLEGTGLSLTSSITAAVTEGTLPIVL